MNILQINGYETPGARFHGLAITPLLKKHGVESQHFAWRKDTNNPDILSFKSIHEKISHKIYQKTEDLLSLQSVIYPYARKIMALPAFKQADLIHLHIIHSGFFSLRHLPELTKQKPTVWTLHDPWALTGHCIHPFECDRWKIGCGSCPDLKTPFSMRRDNTKFQFSYKKESYENSDLDIVVASKWMKDMVEASPMLRNAHVHVIPFGLDLTYFSPLDSKKARMRFGIPEEAIVLSFRAEDEPFKGLSYIIEALEKLKGNDPIYLLTLSSARLKKRVSNRFQIVELGWVYDQEIVRDVYRACDIFLMPSLAESFGMMAVEAMACEKPVIVFEGTALPDVTFAPEVGIAVPNRDSHALSEAIQRLIDHPEERIERGKKCREIAEKVYSEKAHVQAMVNLYKDVLNKSKNKNRSKNIKVFGK